MIKARRTAAEPEVIWGIMQQDKSRVGLEMGITGLLSPLDHSGDQNAHWWVLEHQDYSPSPIHLASSYDQVELIVWQLTVISGALKIHGNCNKLGVREGGMIMPLTCLQESIISKNITVRNWQKKPFYVHQDQVKVYGSILVEAEINNCYFSMSSPYFQNKLIFWNIFNF